MAWIESHQELANHPKTKRLSRTLGISTAQAIGHLHLLWWWALDYAQDGDLSGFSWEDIAEAAQWTGPLDAFAEALYFAGFTDSEDEAETFTLHDWDQYGGKFIKERERGRERQRKHRASLPRDIPPSNAEVTRDSAGSSRVENSTEEKRREENTNDSARGAPAVKGKPRKRISDAWALTPELRTYAIEHGIPAAQVDELAAEFKRYWMGDGRPKADWDLTFMGRVRDQAGRYQARASPNGHPPEERRPHPKPVDFDALRRAP